MSLQHAKGNLLTMAEQGQFDVVVQGCNCWNTMGGGIAREIRERYPVAAEVDADTVRGDYTKLGNYTQATVPGLFNHQFVIVNAYTQFDMSTGQDVFEYVAFELILRKVARQWGSQRIGLPYIGMGLAHGDPDIILAQIAGFADTVHRTGGSVTLVEFA
jgi:O-acetyl-ADP-ribose deacetylase (regulator of RNase III)